MQKVGRRLVAGAAPALAITALGYGKAHSQQAFPTRPIRIIVPFAAGGTTDILARLVAEPLAEILGQPVVIENRTGAAGAIGSAAVAQSPPDGYTLVLATIGTHSVNGLLTRGIGYDAVTDFTPITLLAKLPNVLVINPSIPARSVAELLAYCRANPSSRTYASPGIGTAGHLAGEILRVASGLDLVHVPYRGSSQLLTDIVAGRVPFAFDYLPSSLPFIRAGTVRGLAVTAPQRVAILPQVPTMAEEGFAQFDITTWYAVFGPARMNADVVARLNRAFAEAGPRVRGKLDDLGTQLSLSSPSGLAEFQAHEIDRWSRLIREVGITAE